MKMPNFLKFLKKEKSKDQPAENVQETDLQAGEPIDEESISNGTKIKVIAAFLIVGFAAYIAWWVQEPAEIRADVLSGTEQSDTTQTDQSSSTDTTFSNESPLPEMVAANSTEEQTQAESQQLQMTQEVSIINFAFDPQELNIPTGGTVIWTNQDSVQHSVSGMGFDSGNLDPGQSFTYTFAQDGTYDYACGLHPSETGVIIVGTGASENVSTMETGQPTQENILPVAAENTTQEPPLTPPANILGTTNESAEPVSGINGIGGDESQLHQAAAEQLNSKVKGGRLAKSGPEDYLYVGIFLVILYIRRKSLFQAR